MSMRNPLRCLLPGIAVLLPWGAQGATFGLDTGLRASDPYFSAANPSPVWVTLSGVADFDPGWELALSLRAAPPVSLVSGSAALDQFEESLLLRNALLSGSSGISFQIGAGASAQHLLFASQIVTTLTPTAELSLGSGRLSLRWEVSFLNAPFQQFLGLDFRLL